MKNKRPLKIVVVAMSESIHTVRWLEQIADQGWEIHLFPSNDNGLLHPESPKIIVHHSIYGRRPPTKKGNLAIKGLRVYSNFLAGVSRGILEKIIPDYRTRQLRKLIKKIKPDIIHSMEFQSAGYLVAEAKRKFKGQFPQWIATNWGSDIYLFGRLREHQSKIKEVLANCDFYSCECQRDVCLAQNFGLKAKVLPVFPNSGGFDLDEIKKDRSECQTSKRRKIILKGYQGSFGRALVGLHALERCSDLLKKRNYELIIYSTIPKSDVAMASELFSQKTGVKTTILPDGTSHRKILKAFGQSRLYLGLSISDAISTSLLEALAMGSFPIQSNTSCADEWIEDNKTGILVTPEDPEIIEKAIKKALNDDNLVDFAAKANWQVAQKRLAKKLLKEKTIDLYASVIKENENISK